MDALGKVLERIKRAQENAEKTTKDTQPQYECPICQDTLFIMQTDENGVERATYCRCKEKKQARLLMKNSGISEQDMAKGFNDFQTFDESPLIQAKQTAARYCKDFEQIRDSRNNSLLLCGASGRGKTTLGIIVANNLINKCVGVRYMPYRDEVTRLKQEITEERIYNEHITRLKTAKVLFIDDMLKGKITESDINIMYEIVNYRYLERLPLIISTECTPQQLLNFDEAIGSRILEMSKGYAVVFDSSTLNYRLR